MLAVVDTVGGSVGVRDCDEVEGDVWSCELLGVALCVPEMGGLLGLYVVDCVIVIDGAVCVWDDVGE